MTRRLFKLGVLTALFILMVSSAFAYSGTSWRSINRSCYYGAKVGVSASGLVAVRFYLTSGYSYYSIVNFGAGMSREVSVPFRGAYSGVAISGNNLSSVGTASCR